MKKLLATSAIALALATTGGSNANAQAIDYGSLKELFGEPVTTSANGSPQKESEVPLNMDIITDSDIKKMGARSIPEILRTVPGVTVRQFGFSQYEVSIRGYNQPNAERLLVLVNGRQVYLDYFGLVNWENIPVEIPDIQQIEVVKGPNTALFGFNAVSGVVNIITYNPLYEDVGELQIRGGTDDLTEASVVKSFKFGDDVGAKISAGGFDSGDFDDIENKRAETLVDNDRRSVGLDAWWQVTDNVQAQFEATRNDTARNEEIVTRSSSSTSYDTNSIRGRILADTDWGLWEADLYHNATRADINLLLDENTGLTTLFGVDNRITVGKLNNTFKAGPDHTFRLSGEYRAGTNIFVGKDALTTNRLDQGSDLSYEILGFGGLWDWAINDKLNSSVAVRYDMFDLNKEGPTNNIFINNALNPADLGITEDDFDSQDRNELSLNLGLVYKATDHDTFRLTAARGVDLPSFTEFGLQFVDSGNGLVFAGDPDVESSIVYNYELGYNRRVNPIDGSFNAAVFYQYNEEMQGFGARFVPANALVPGDLTDSLISNIGDSEAYGFEVSLDGVYRNNLTWDVSYAYIEIDDDIRNQGLNPSGTFPYSSFVEYEESVSNHMIGAHVNYQHDDWNFDVFGKYKTSFDDMDPVSGSALDADLKDVNDQLLLHANIAYDVTDNLRWSVSGSSLTGQTQQNGRVDADRIVFTTLGVKF